MFLNSALANYLSFADAGIIALLGYAVVFFGLILLMLVVMALGKIMTAKDYRQFTHMDKSSFGGIVPIMGQQNPPHKTGVKGLYFVGQQSENGGGVGAVMVGAKSAWDKAKKA